MEAILQLDDPAPQIALTELADSSVNFVVRPWVKSADYWNVYTGLMENIKKAFDANGITIPFPQRDVHLYEHK
jgi:small conductance mechanosensitive channel